MIHRKIKTIILGLQIQTDDSCQEAQKFLPPPFKDKSKDKTQG